MATDEVLEGRVLDQPNSGWTPLPTGSGNLSSIGIQTVVTASASHPDPSTLTPAERAHLGIA